MTSGFERAADLMVEARSPYERSGSTWSERVISSSADIPVPDPRWPSRGVNLIGMSSAEAQAQARAGGASAGRYGWWVERRDPFPFDQLDDLLPRMARRVLVPQVVDLIPSSSWFASLANMLVASSWSSLRDPVIRGHGGCEECGVRSGLEGHETWSYDDVLGRQTLIGIRSLCFQCHETQHLGRANVNGRFERVFDRLCRMNRLEAWERPSFHDEIVKRWETRSKREWDLDLVVDDDMILELKSSIIYGGDNWIVQPANARRGEVASRIVNAQVLTDGKRLVIVS